ncbi:phosphohistidine phosphatase SixA [Shewanella sp. OPT22]|nr:phosphohistidine phosphatase SixA [Shewanella sp. OPT22]
MQLFLMRHGEASYQADSDRERILTDLGAEQAKVMAVWLSKTITQFDLVLVSPYVRAQQTWKNIVDSNITAKKVCTLTELTPSSEPSQSSTAIEAYAEHYKADTVLVVAHMPLLGYLVNEFIPSEEPPLFATAGITILNLLAEGRVIESQNSPETVSIER